jgi:murein DD-endopeptidase MepM/ murein hydrolase activator NlpD
VFTPTALVFKPSPTSANTATPVGTPGVVRYTVKSGDTLISIAATFSTTVQSIILINGLDGPFIRAGAEITVPFGVWQPTDTPTVYVAPSVTPTPVFAYDAPQLLWPPDGALFAASDKITLMWTAPGLLTLNEFYVVRIRCTANAQERQTPYEVRQGTALNLDKPPCPLPTQFTWQVLVVSQTEGGAPIASSPLSATRMFGWE